MPDRYCFPALFSIEKGKILVTYPDLDCSVLEKDEKAAFRAAQIRLGRHLFQMEQTGAKIPDPTSIFEVDTLPDQKTCMIDVYMPSVRVAENNRAVNRMVTLPAWMNAAAMERNINFSHTLQEALRKELFHDYAE